MNSLAAISARVSPTQTPVPSRSNSIGNVLTPVTGSRRGSTKESAGKSNNEVHEFEETPTDEQTQSFEKVALVAQTSYSNHPTWLNTAASVFIESISWVLSTIISPGVYLIAWLYDETGKFAPLMQMKRLGVAIWGGRRHPFRTERVSSQADARPSQNNEIGRGSGGRRFSKALKIGGISGSSSSGISSESDSERERVTNKAEGGSQRVIGRHTRSKSLQPAEEIAPARRSIRIKLHNEDNLRQRKHRISPSTNTISSGARTLSTGEISPVTLKSPTSQAASLSMTKYPRAPAPPRPLIPQRQPSYTLQEPLGGKLAQKTLILDLDETLIHSMAKGGRMSTGHMVEVKLSTVVGTSLGPQHPILYWVNKRPHCDDFLRRVCKWYNLVVFTASVQEYADPVIDWLEQERKFFSGRYYRQHCTYRHGAFIKDLSSVEPDLSKVMILDNSPLSYMFHQDNAIPIEGWINDPTDNDLMHLIPLLEGLQYVTDVRALLALRGGEDGKHMIA